MKMLFQVSVVVGLLALLAPARGQAFNSPPVPAPFSQEVWASDVGFMGGVAFAPDGDVWVASCSGSFGSMRRFDAQTTVLVNGTLIHPLIANVGTNTGCGLTNHSNGFLYSNTFAGVTRQDASTGLPAGGPFGSPGNALGIAVHPVTKEVVYVGAGAGPIFAVDPDFTTSRIVSMATLGSFVDGISFDPSGVFLLTATRNGPGGFRVTVIRFSDGSLVQDVLLTSEPDGIVFHASSPKFVLTNNTDGTLSRIDFPGDDFTQPGIVSLFAGGGFRGDLSQVGSDGCAYLTQDGTHFDNGVSTTADSIVHLCPGFAPPVGVGQISLAPTSDTNFVGEAHTVTATVTEDGNPVAGAVVTFDVISGPQAGVTGTDTSDASGEATFTYAGLAAGIDTLQASFVDGTGTTQFSNTVTQQWLSVPILVIDNGCPGSSGTPILTFTGLLLPASVAQVDLVNAVANAPGAILVGVESATLVREGCTLLFAPSFSVPITTDVAGAFSSTSHWPAGVPSGLSVFLQAYVLDGGAATGFATSNTIQITTP